MELVTSHHHDISKKIGLNIQEFEKNIVYLHIIYTSTSVIGLLHYASCFQETSMIPARQHVTTMYSGACRR
jgi:hypothetical protein